MTEREAFAGSSLQRRVFSPGTLLVFLAVALLLVAGYVAVALPGDRGSASGRPSDVDIGFAQDMVMHHQQAVTMAQIVRGRVGPQIAALAYGMESDQLQEIGQLDGFLDLWGKPRLPSGKSMTWMSGRPNVSSHSAHDGHLMVEQPTETHQSDMPGMATQTELNQMQEISGRKLEVRFLQLMLRHHQGGAPMAAYAARYAAVPAVRAVGQRIAFAQTLEIERMTVFLQQRDAQPLPSPV
ncbi:DUF305 domain-containing protein [Streptomyces sp. NBC_00028]|uniref:DUF305 domain-containing protein n=1 Tax=Streptomyces sp. NBC_00028 TaxID=2975624 RepID=UPI0032498A9A